MCNVLRLCKIRDISKGEYIVQCLIVANLNVYLGPDYHDSRVSKLSFILNMRKPASIIAKQFWRFLANLFSELSAAATATTTSGR